MPSPDPRRLYPDVHGPNFGRAQVQQVVFLKPLVEHPLTEVGEYTYYADPRDPTGFEHNNVLFHYGPERLVIGRYCALARDVRFVMNAANHRRSGVSTYPFPMLGGDWLEHMPLFAQRPTTSDTIVGSDVWLGYRVTVLPGVRIGNGAVVAAGSVVSGDVDPFTVVGGNPARVMRRRFDRRDVQRLERIAWWDWPAAVVTRHVPVIMSGDVDALERAAHTEGLLPDEPARAGPSTPQTEAGPRC